MIRWLANKLLPDRIFNFRLQEQEWWWHPALREWWSIGMIVENPFDVPLSD